MMSKKIVDSDAFLDMPASSQLLYFHLVMRADDEGFVGNPKKIIRMISAGDDDYKILIAKRFLITFETGVVVIKHWLIHNTIRMDRFNPTTYKDERDLILIKENKAYTENTQSGAVLAPSRQHKLIKSNLIKSNIKAKNEEKLPEWLNKKKWNEWLIYRKELGKKMTPSTIKKQLKLLERNKQNQEAIIDKSISCGYIGLFEINIKNSSTSDKSRAYDKIIKENEEKKYFDENVKNNEKLVNLKKSSIDLKNKFKVE